MTDHHDPDTPHPTEEQIVAWVDEGPAAVEHLRLGGHLAVCFACRARVEEVREIVSDLRTGVAIPAPEVFAEQRERIRTAIEAESVPHIVPITRRRGRSALLWVPMVAAALVAGVLLMGPDAAWWAGDPVQPLASVDRARDPAVLASAQQAAEEAIAVVDEAARWEVNGATRLELADAIDTLDPVVTTAETVTDEFSLLEDEFAALSQEEQAAVLDEMEQMVIEL